MQRFAIFEVILCIVYRLRKCDELFENKAKTVI